ncbi:hypothetical protein D3C87_1936970 [compost metagenome]
MPTVVQFQLRKRVEPVDHFETAVFQGIDSHFAGKMVNMPYGMTQFHEMACKCSQCREIERDVENLVFGMPGAFPDKLKIILYVLKNVDHKQQIEFFIGL